MVFSFEVCEAIRSAIDIHFPPSEGLEIIAEPGQFLVTSAYSLVVKVLHKRKRSAKIGGEYKLFSNDYKLSRMENNSESPDCGRMRNLQYSG